MQEVMLQELAEKQGKCILLQKAVSLLEADNDELMAELEAETTKSHELKQELASVSTNNDELISELDEEASRHKHEVQQLKQELVDCWVKYTTKEE